MRRVRMKWEAEHDAIYKGEDEEGFDWTYCDHLPEITSLCAKFVRTHPQLLGVAVETFSNLSELCISDMKLNEIPVEIRRLLQLRKLYARNNFFAELPGWLSEMPQLELIDIPFNRIKNISLFKFRKIRINAMFNYLMRVHVT